MQRKKPSASMADVAALAKVSPQTVSRVARGEGTVRDETAARVNDAMNKLGYVPNVAARALRSGRFNSIGIAAHHITRTGEAHIIQAVTRACRAHGYRPILTDSASGEAAELSTSIEQLSTIVDGLVVLRLETEDLQPVRLPLNLPIVVSDSRHLGDYVSVGSDQIGGARLAVSHLLGLGHRTVHMIGGPEHSVQASARHQAWKDLLVATGRDVPPVLMGDWTPKSGYLAGQRLADDPDVTAVFSANDEMAQGLLRALHEAGRRVPEEVSVVGFDDIAAEYMWPPLTTVAQDFTRIGEELVSTLMRQMSPNSSTKSQQVLVPGELKVRRSTAYLDS